jgi:hypothetical protein
VAYERAKPTYIILSEYRIPQDVKNIEYFFLKARNQKDES